MTHFHPPDRRWEERRRTLRERASSVVRSRIPPTVQIGLPGRADVDERQARAVIDLTLRTGEALLSTGASAGDTVATLLRLTDAYGITSTHVDVQSGSILISMNRGPDEDPLTVSRVIRAKALDYSRLEALLSLVDDVARTGLAVEDARARLDALLTAPHPYQRWVVTVGLALLGAGIVALFDSSPATWLVAGLSAALVDRAQRRLSRTPIAAFFVQAFSAAIITVIAVAAHWLRTQGVAEAWMPQPSLVVISGIIVLLAGLTVIGAAQDAIDGYYVTATARITEVIMMTLGIALGISLVLGVASRLQISPEIGDTLGIGGPVLDTTIAAVVLATGFALSTYMSPRMLPAVIAATVAGWLAYQVVGSWGVGVGTRSALAATVVGVCAALATRWFRIPTLAVATGGIVTMFPGMAVYRGLNAVQQGPGVDAALVHLIEAASIGLGLAAGVTLGIYVVRAVGGLDASLQRARRSAAGTLRD